MAKTRRQAGGSPRPEPKKNNRFYRILILIFISLLLILGGINYFRTVDPQELSFFEPAFIEQGQLSFISSGDSSLITTIKIEVADTPDKIQQGLMFRRSMAEDHGMLFLMGREQPQSFWMKNTRIPLDIIYVNSRKEIVTIQANTTPMSQAPIPSERPALYVVEVNAGFSARHGINRGDLIEFEIYGR